MVVLKGRTISPGYATGVAVVYDVDIERKLELPDRTITQSDVQAEFGRIDDALTDSSRELQQIEKDAESGPNQAQSSLKILSAHSAMANEIAALVKDHVGAEFVNVETALESVIRDWVERFQRLDSEYFRQREQDVRDVGRRMKRHLSGYPLWNQAPLPPGSIVVADELLPSEAVELFNSGVVAIVSEQGGEFSHTAIVAQSMMIPAVSGIRKVTLRIKSGMQLLVDGESGTVIVEPETTEKYNFEKRKLAYEKRGKSVGDSVNLPCVTQDGVEITLLANVGRPEEVARVSEHNLGGVGLFRTEFLYLESHKRPSVEAQSKMYGKMAKGLGDLPLVIRTFDLGGDKLPPFLLTDSPESQVGLNLRGLRFSLIEQELLHTQLQAIVQISEDSNARILFPMVIGSDDFARAITAVEDAVKAMGLIQKPQIGAMIETPAALFALDEICELADFVAIGTNDLTQYMLATDRDLIEASEYCTAMHPAVLRAIKQISDAGERWQIPVCACGEEAGNAAFACLLIGLGVRELSLSPSRADDVRTALRNIKCQDAESVASKALQCRSSQQVRELVQDFQLKSPGGKRLLSKHLPKQ